VPFELQIALRYLLAKRRQVFISVITLVSTLGVAVGVLALVIALAIMTGLQQELQDRILGAMAHVNVWKTGGLDDYRSEIERLKQVPDIVAAAPAVYGKALVSTDRGDMFITLKGVDPALERDVTEVAASMVLQHHGMDPKKDVTFMTIGGAETSIVAMRNGIIQARAFNPDAAYIMKKQGFTELGVLADMGPWPWAGYSTSDAHLANRRDKLKRWTRAMVKSLQLMQSRPEETYKIAQAEFKHPRDITEGAANICIKAIDPRNPGGASDESLRNNIDLTITQPLKLAAQPPIAKLVDFSLLHEVQRELGIRK